MLLTMYRLRRRAAVGFGVFAAAMPAPMPGCMMKKGATIVETPSNTAPARVGASVHALPKTARLNAARDLRLLLRSESEGRIEAVAGSFGDAAASYFAMILDNEPDVNLEALDCSKVEDGMECTRTAFGNAGGSHGDATGDAGQPFGDARDRQ